MKAYLRLLRFLLPHRVKFGFALACMVMYSITATLSLTVIQPFMKLMFATATGGSASSPDPFGNVPLSGFGRLLGPARAWNHWLFDAPQLVGFERLCLAVLVLFLLKNIAEYSSAYLSVAVEQAAMRDLRRALYAHLQRLSLSYYHGKRTGTLISRLTNDVEALREALSASTSNIIKDGLTLIGYLTVTFLASWRLALVSILIVPPAALALTAVARKMRRRSGHTQERMAEISNVLQETITGARVVKAFGMEHREEERFDRANTGYFHAFVRLRRVSAALKPISEYVIIGVSVVIAWTGARDIFVNHTLPPERLFQFVAALLATISPIKSLSEVNSRIATGLGAADRVFSLLDAPPAIVDGKGARQLAPLATAIRYENVGFGYDPGTTVLTGVNFEVHRGQVVALVGVEADALTEALVPLGPDDSAWLDDLAPHARPGARVPIQRAAATWVDEARALAGPSGRLVVFDYAARTADLADRGWLEWLRTYRSHERGGAPLERLGLQDITCEVAVDQLGVPPASDTSQADWLRAHGIDELVTEGRAVWGERAAIGDLAAVRAKSRIGEAEALTDPSGLGAFRVLEWPGR